MASVEFSQNHSNPSSERPRTIETSWVALGLVVYGWTDQREASVDKAWWQEQRPHLYLPVPPCELANQPDADQAVDVEESAPTELIEARLSDGAGGSGNWIYRSNLRVA